MLKRAKRARVSFEPRRQSLSSYYGETLLRWLTEEGCYNPNLEWLASKSPSLLLPQSISEKFSAKAEAYWNGKFGQKHMTLNEALAKMSRLLLGELRTVRNFVVKTHTPLNIFELEELRVKFSMSRERLRWLTRLQLNCLPH